MIDDQIKMIYAVQIPLVFPEGFSIGGANGSSNAAEIDRNGAGIPVIRGTSLAGILRSAAENEAAFEDVVFDYFGYPLERDWERGESRLIFSDCAVQCGTDTSTHNLINRHTGSTSTLNKGLFSMERVVPGAKCTVGIRLNSNGKDPQKDCELLKFIAEYLNGGCFIGGRHNRGIGRCQVENNCFMLAGFDMSKVEDAAAYLDFMYSNSNSSAKFREVKITEYAGNFRLKAVFRIPAGEDLLCGTSSEAIPDSIISADGKEYWKIPGSSLRGVFKAWFSRLVARDGEKLADSAEEYLASGEHKNVEINKQDMITDLFGSLEKRGRIHIGDALSNRSANHNTDEQKRTHVVIDRFTGGTNDGKLFFNTVLVSSNNLTFECMISIAGPTQKELDLLKNTLQALHLGLIRVGSSKSSGRLEVAGMEILSIPDGLEFNTQLKGF